MNILVLAAFPDSIPAFRGDLLKALVAAGHHVRVAAPGLAGAPETLRFLGSIGAEALDVPMHRTGTNPLADLALLARLARLMRSLRPDAFLGYTAKPVIWGTLAAAMARVPRRYALITGLGYAFTGQRRGAVARLVGLLYRGALRFSHKVFFQNPDDEALFRGSGILPVYVPSVVVNGSGVDVVRFRPGAPCEGPASFLMIGRLLGDKGVREYVEAARRVRRLRPEARFRLAGWIDSNPDAIAPAELEEWIASGTVEFLGRLDDVRPAIASASVYVLPSYREGTPRTVLEAMAMGRAIITTDAPGCRQTVAHGENGFLVPVRSAQALAGAMLRFLDDPGLAARMGARSRRIAEERYDVRKVNARMLAEMGFAGEPAVREAYV
ncbi:MAG TPA: glycosyltransferase family 4 protein [Pseudoxanthomonas sp.]|nr:glycosyltransferase family 4 protein [Pseudoxanthomonas sp.]